MYIGSPVATWSRAIPSSTWFATSSRCADRWYRLGGQHRHAHLSGAGKRESFCLPNTRFLIHQPAGGFGGTATDVEIHAREILKTRERINAIIAERTGQPLERVEKDTDRDYWMSPEESVEYGIVGGSSTTSRNSSDSVC